MLKRLARKHRSLPNDLEELIDALEEDPEQGVLVQANVRKIRLAIKSKNKGKSGGARVLTYLVFQDVSKPERKELILFSVYDKSEVSTLSDSQIGDLLGVAGLK